MATSSLYCNFSSISQATVFRDLSGAEKRFAELIPSQTSKETSAALLQLCREAEVGCVFVTSPPADLICRQCRLVLRDPHQTQCCGGLYCGYCLRQQLDSSKQCPLCLSRQVRAFRDVSVTRRIDSLLVRCSNERHGCKWVGELGSLADHLKVCNKKPSVCRTCGKVFSNDLIREHETSECEKRKFQCPYCNEYNSTYQEVTEHHWPTCLFYPLFCPNECGKGYLPRKDVLKHLREECEVKKKLVELSTSIKALEAQLQERDAEIEELRMKDSDTERIKLRDKRIRELEMQNSNLKKSLGHTEHDLTTQLQAMKSLCEKMRDEKESLELKLSSFTAETCM